MIEWSRRGIHFLGGGVVWAERIACVEEGKCSERGIVWMSKVVRKCENFSMDFNACTSCHNGSCSLRSNRFVYIDL